MSARSSRLLRSNRCPIFDQIVVAGRFNQTVVAGRFNQTVVAVDFDRRLLPTSILHRSNPFIVFDPLPSNFDSPKLRSVHVCFECLQPILGVLKHCSIFTFKESDRLLKE